MGLCPVSTAFNATEHLGARVAPGSLPFKTTAHPLIGVLAAPAGQSDLVSVAREGAGEHERLKSSVDAINMFGRGGARIAGKGARRGEACARGLVAHDDPVRGVDAVSELAVEGPELAAEAGYPDKQSLGGNVSGSNAK